MERNFNFSFKPSKDKIDSKINHNNIMDFSINYKSVEGNNVEISRFGNANDNVDNGMTSVEDLNKKFNFDFLNDSADIKDNDNSRSYSQKDTDTTKFEYDLNFGNFQNQILNDLEKDSRIVDNSFISNYDIPIPTTPSNNHDNSKKYFNNSSSDKSNSNNFNFYNNSFKVSVKEQDSSNTTNSNGISKFNKMNCLDKNCKSQNGYYSNSTNATSNNTYNYSNNSNSRHDFSNTILNKVLKESNDSYNNNNNANTTTYNNIYTHNQKGNNCNIGVKNNINKSINNNTNTMLVNQQIQFNNMMNSYLSSNLINNNYINQNLNNNIINYNKQLASGFYSSSNNNNYIDNIEINTLNRNNNNKINNMENNNQFNNIQDNHSSYNNSYRIYPIMNNNFYNFNKNNTSINSVNNNYTESAFNSNYNRIKSDYGYNNTNKNCNNCLSIDDSKTFSQEDSILTDELMQMSNKNNNNHNNNYTQYSNNNNQFSNQNQNLISRTDNNTKVKIQENDSISNSCMKILSLNKTELINYSFTKKGSQAIQWVLEANKHNLKEKSNNNINSNTNPHTNNNTKYIIKSIDRNNDDNYRHTSSILKHLNPNLQSLINKLLSVSTELLENQFSSFAFQRIVSFLTPEQRIQVWLSLKTKIEKFANHKIANRCIQELICYCNTVQEEAVIISLLTSSNSNNSNKEDLSVLTNISNNEFGFYVILEVLEKLNTENFIKLITRIENILDNIVVNKFGVNVFKKAIVLLEQKINEIENIISNNPNDTKQIGNNQQIFYISLLKNLKETIIEKINNGFSDIIKMKYGFYSVIFLIEIYGLKQCVSIVKNIIYNVEEYCVSSFSYKVVKKVLNCSKEVSGYIIMIIIIIINCVFLAD